MRKKGFWTFKAEHALNNELNMSKLETIIPYTSVWNQGVEKKNDTAVVTLHFDDGDVKLAGIRSNGNDVILLESWEEV